jgi:hypothetical protein
MSTSDLEIGIHRWDANRYAVELRFRLPDEDANIPPVRGYVQLDLKSFSEVENDMAAYSRLLTDALFSDPQVLEGFNRAREMTEAELRLRLFIGPSAPELHSLRWEALLDPQRATSLSSDEKVFFSRYLSSHDWRTVTRRTRSNIRALVVVANPTDIGRYERGGESLKPIDVEKELARARQGLKGIRTDEFVSEVTLDNISAQLKSQHYDIIYLVCHGAFRNGQALLYLQDEDGSTKAVAGDDFAERLGQLRDRPSLAVLVSCQSAGVGIDARTTDGGVLAALGPRLAQMGVPAVLAMQSDVSMSSMETFMPAFFQSLGPYGQVDSAVAAARGTIFGRNDSWVPVLFMRLESGRIWRLASTAGAGDNFSRWRTLTSDISLERYTPILGSSLLEPYVGSSRELARRLAETYLFPMSPFHSDDLPQVSQYVSVKEREDVTRSEVIREMLEELRLRFEKELQALRAAGKEPPPEPTEAADLLKHLDVMGKLRRQANPSIDAYALLAQFPFKMIITTNPDNLLTDALEANGKSPKVDYCRWKTTLLDDNLEEVDWPGTRADEWPDFKPSVETPLVYHLYGNLEYPDSLVLTEDNYFDYLIGVTKNQDTHPGMVKKALSDTALLFLGFKIDDWDFRVLFRSLRMQEGNKSGKLTHVAVQIDPEGDRIIDPDRARRYLKKYFGDIKIEIYWGSAEDFLKDLRREWNSSRYGAKFPVR